MSELRSSPSFEQFQRALGYIDQHRDSIRDAASKFHSANAVAMKKMQVADYFRAALHACVETAAREEPFPSDFGAFAPAWSVEPGKFKSRSMSKSHLHSSADQFVQDHLDSGNSPESLLFSRNRPNEVYWFSKSSVRGRSNLGYGSWPAYLRVVFGIRFDAHSERELFDHMFGPVRVPPRSEKPRTVRTVPKKTVAAPAASPPLSRLTALAKPAPSTPRLPIVYSLQLPRGKSYKGISGAIDLAADVAHFAVMRRESGYMHPLFWENHPRLKPVHADIRDHVVNGRYYAGHGSWREFVRTELNCPPWLLSGLPD